MVTLIVGRGSTGLALALLGIAFEPLVINGPSSDLFARLVLFPPFFLILKSEEVTGSRSRHVTLF